MARRPSLLATLGLVLGMAAVAAFFYRIRGVFVTFFVGLILAYAMNPLVDFLERKGAPRVAATLIVYAGFVFLVVVTGTFVFPALLSQLEEAIKVLPEEVALLEGSLRHLYHRFDRFEVPQVVRVALDEGIRRGEAYLRSLVARSVEGLISLFSKAVYVVLAPVLAFYLTKDFRVIKASLLRWLPVMEKGRWIELLEEVDRVLGGFIRGQLIVCGFIGMLVTLGLALLGIRFALLIGILAGILNIIPYFGPVLGALPAVILALFKSPLTAIYVVLLFVGLHELEGGVISPKILGDRVGLHPLVIIFALLAGGEVLGIWGMLLAVPLAACLGAILRFFLREREEPSS